MVVGGGAAGSSLPRLLIILLLLPVAGIADDSDFLGTWSYIVNEFPADDDCGEQESEGVLHVLYRLPKMKTQAYAAALTGRIHSEYCELRYQQVQVVLRVDGDAVKVVYLDSNWAPDILTRDGDSMQGADRNGIETTWSHRPDPELETRQLELAENLRDWFSIDSKEDFDYYASESGFAHSDWRTASDEYASNAAACVINYGLATSEQSQIPKDQVLNALDPYSVEVIAPEFRDAFGPQDLYARTEYCRDEAWQQLAAD